MESMVNREEYWLLCFFVDLPHLKINYGTFHAFGFSEKENIEHIGNNWL